MCYNLCLTHTSERAHTGTYIAHHIISYHWCVSPTRRIARTGPCRAHSHQKRTATGPPAGASIRQPSGCQGPHGCRRHECATHASRPALPRCSCAAQTIPVRGPHGWLRGTRPAACSSGGRGPQHKLGASVFCTRWVLGSQK